SCTITTATRPASGARWRAASSTRSPTASSPARRRRCPSTRRSSPSARCSASRTPRRSFSPTTSATCSAWTRSRWASRSLSWPRRSNAAGSTSARSACPSAGGTGAAWSGSSGVAGGGQGSGARLAEGAWRLAASVHPEGTKLVYAVKGLELPAHSARALKGLSIGYATATRGGSHHDTRPTPQYAQGFDRRGTKDKPAFAVRSQHFTALGDSLVLCRFTSERGLGVFIGDPYAPVGRAPTGWDVTVEELERIGERIITLERLFNVREGVRRAQDVLPWKVMPEAIPARA